MFKKTLLLSALIILPMLIIVSCDSYMGYNPDDKETNRDQTELGIISGGENATLKVQKGINSYFHLDLSNTGSNQHLSTGIREGWSILWESPISHNITYDNVTLYSTFEEENWKAVNYLLNEKESLIEEDNELTYREIQAAIWTLIDFSGFDLDDIQADLLPADMAKNGEVLFNTENVRQLVDRANANAHSFQYSSKTTYAVVVSSEQEGKFMIFEETAYAFEVVDLNSEYNMVVAWDVNDNGQIIGGELFWDDQSGLMNMGNIFARALNNNGEVAGTSGSQAAFWSTGTGVINLSSLNGDASEANDINENGQIVGEVMYESLLYEDEEFGDEYDYEFKAFVWNNSEESKTIGEDGSAAGINNNSFVVGTDYTIPDRGYIWDEQSGIKSLGSFSGFSSARPNAINNNNYVAGSVLVDQNGNGSMIASARTADSHLKEMMREIDRAFKHAGVSGSYDHFHIMEMMQNSNFGRDAFPWNKEISRSKLDFSELEQKIRGKIGHSSISSTRSEAFIWNENDGMMNLGTLGGSWSTAWDVNDHGQVVGYSDVGNGEHRAFFWDEEYGMIELPSLGGNSLARAMNNEGQIVGYSYDTEGNFFPVMWNVSMNQP